MRQLNRLLRYLKPYWLHILASVLAMALVGVLEAFRLLLIGPIFDRVLNPSSHGRDLPLFRMPITNQPIQLGWFVPQHFHNVWTMVAFALVASTVLKGLFDYLGTYLANYAGFGMITDLRNELYTATLRRSVAFFQKYSTGTLLSAIVSDIDRVQYAVSTVVAEFLQQFFTFLFTAVVVILLGGRLTWVLAIFVPVIIVAARRVGQRVRTTTRKGQDKVADIQNILQETITGVRIVKAFSMEAWETKRFREAARRLFKANLRSVSAYAVSSPMMDIFGAIAIAVLILVGREYIKHGVFTEGVFLAFIIAVFKLYEPVRKFGQFHNNFQQALGASSAIFNFLDAQDDVREKPGAVKLPPFHQGVRFEHVYFGYENGDGAREVLHDINLEVSSGRGGRDRRLQRLRARPRWCTCCRASSTSLAGACSSTATTFAISPLRRCARRSPSSPRTRSCSTTRCATTSPTASRTCLRRQWKMRPARRWRTTSSWGCPRATTR